MSAVTFSGAWATRMLGMRPTRPTSKMRRGETSGPRFRPGPRGVSMIWEVLARSTAVRRHVPRMTGSISEDWRGPPVVRLLLREEVACRAEVPARHLLADLASARLALAARVNAMGKGAPSADEQRGAMIPYGCLSSIAYYAYGAFGQYHRAWSAVSCCCAQKLVRVDFCLRVAIRTSIACGRDAPNDYTPPKRL